MPQHDAKDIRRGHLPPADMFNELQQAAAEATRIDGVGVSQYPAAGMQILPPDIESERIWIIITGHGSSSSSDASSGSSSSGGNTGAVSNRYSWVQGVAIIQDNGEESIEVDPAGLTGTSDSNPAIEVNFRQDVPEGARVRGYLSASKNAWHFVYGGNASESSGKRRFVLDCENGTIDVLPNDDGPIVPDDPDMPPPGSSSSNSHPFPPPTTDDDPTRSGDDGGGNPPPPIVPDGPDGGI